MFQRTTAQRTAGKKPVSHQASIVLTARLSQRPVSDKNENEARFYADVGEIALVDNRATRYNRYPEPEYSTDFTGYLPDAESDPTAGNNEERNEDLKTQWTRFSFLGIVQTPGSCKGQSPSEAGHYNGKTNVIHAGGTMTTINTSARAIETNQLVTWYIPFENTEDALPDSWNATKTGSKYQKNKTHVVTMGIPYNDTDLLQSAMAHNAIIGRAITRAEPGGQLDLIMTH